MELQTTMNQIRALETLFQDLTELPVDCDFTLPDYLPDIAAVLKCIMKPVIQNHQVSGDRVMADGTVYLHLLYLDEDRKCVRSFETSQAFTCSFTVKEMNSNNTVHLNAKVNYVNCRATGPRHVDIHGAFSVTLSVQGEREHQILQSANCENLCVKTSRMDYSCPVGFEEKMFTVSEVLELANGQGAEVLLRTQAVPYITDCKILSGKAIVKGEISLKTVYATDTVTGTMGRSENTVLFSQIIDVDGLDEQCRYTCEVSALQCEAHPAQNSGGENKLLSFTAKLRVMLHAFKTETVEVADDAYHTSFPLETVTMPLQLCTITDVIREMQTAALSLELPDEELVGVEDLWCDIGGVSCRCEEEESLADAQATVCMLTRDSRGCLSYYERPASFSLSYPTCSETMTADIHVIGTQWVMADKRLEIQLRLCVQHQHIDYKEKSILCEMQADEKQPFTVNDIMKDCCMKVYFASAGESTWDIAKYQHVPLERLCVENDVNNAILQEDAVLLFPLK